MASPSTSRRRRAAALRLKRPPRAKAPGRARAPAKKARPEVPLDLKSPAYWREARRQWRLLARLGEPDPDIDAELEANLKDYDDWR